jgi:hypothetical protein
MTELLHQTWRPHEFFMLIMWYSQIVNKGLLADTIPLVNWMCVTCTAQAHNGVHSCLGHTPLHVPVANNGLVLNVLNVTNLLWPSSLAWRQCPPPWEQPNFFELGSRCRRATKSPEDAMDQAMVASIKTLKDH